MRARALLLFNYQRPTTLRVRHLCRNDNDAACCCQRYEHYHCSSRELERDGDIMYHGVRLSRRKGLPWSIAASRPRIESRRCLARALHRAKTIRAILCPAGGRASSRGSSHRLSCRAAQMRAAPRSAFAVKPTVIIHSLWLCRGDVRSMCDCITTKSHPHNIRLSPFHRDAR